MARVFLGLLSFAVILVVVSGAGDAKSHNKKGKKSDDVFAPPAKPVYTTGKQLVCEREKVQCGAGRECVADEDGEPTCICMRECVSHSHPVCGTNGKSYDNHCELHREACIEGIKIHIQHDGLCASMPSPTPETVKPVVCFQSDRDILRQKLIDWMIQQEIPAGWFTDGRSYKDIIQMFFDKYDETSDGKLDSNELLHFVEGNETVSNVTHNSEGENAILRGLCVDALIDISDDDADWALNLEEFQNCMNPEFSPPYRSCSLEDENYKDGAETKVNCNSCVCACGNWVCTAMVCDDEDPSLAKTSKDEINEKEKEDYDPAKDLPDEMTEDEFKEYIRKLTEDNVDEFLEEEVEGKIIEAEKKEKDLKKEIPGGKEDKMMKLSEKEIPVENFKMGKSVDKKEKSKDAHKL
ncbi:follistatin-like 1 precursor [Saccoglossus kowalevskii]|uniref:Follistatin-related protein 1 n=1 Tax=Saccoglossus kowalevskii TaxID=10224 RepID=B5LVY2_SACKO|nr:follistatin-like 1 precursor [Saccoglossus kowalevskii]ACG76355.1 follistatin-like protein [Saccoglossus kowalevskii]